MPKPYEDDLRNDIAGTLAARTPGVSTFDNSVGMGLQNTGKMFAQPTGLGNTANTAVPQIGGAGSSFVPIGGNYMPPQARQPAQAQQSVLGQQPILGQQPVLGTQPMMDPMQLAARAKPMRKL